MSFWYKTFHWVPGFKWLYERSVFHGKVLRFLREAGPNQAAVDMWSAYHYEPEIQTNVLTRTEYEALGKVRQRLKDYGLEADELAYHLKRNLDRAEGHMGIFPGGPSVYTPAVLLFGLGILAPALSPKTRQDLLPEVEGLKRHSWGAVRNPAYHAHRLLATYSEEDSSE